MLGPLATWGAIVFPGADLITLELEYYYGQADRR